MEKTYKQEIGCKDSEIVHTGGNKGLTNPRNSCTHATQYKFMCFDFLVIFVVI